MVGDDDRVAETQPDDTVPSAERQAELETAHQANVAAEKLPYEGVAIKTRGELTWVMKKRGWSGEFTLPSGKERANLSGARLVAANLSMAQLESANLSGAVLMGTDLTGATLNRANLSGAHLWNADLFSAFLDSSNLFGASLVDADLSSASLESANLSMAQLESANLSGAVLESANLSGASLVGVNLSSASLESADLSGADLRECQLNVVTRLVHPTLDVAARLADIIWNDALLTRISWETVPTLGDEAVARQRKEKDGKRKDRKIRVSEYEAATRAYRQLAVALRDQGMNDDADRYAYRAQVMQRSVLRLRRRWSAAFGSWLLDLISGYGYRPVRSVFTYALVILTFAAAYFALTKFCADTVPALALVTARLV